MTYKLIIKKEAEYQLTKTDNKTAKRILEKIYEASKNPTHFFERLSGRLDSKLRVGDWRVIAYIDNKRKHIFVTSIGHRKNIYK